MLILGVDPGTTTTGYGFLKVEDKTCKVVEFELIETQKNSYAPERYGVIYDAFIKLLNKYKPDVMAIERVFFAANAKTAINVGQAQGVMFLAAAHTGTQVVEYAPGNIKKLVSGNGRANKKEMQAAVRKILGNRVKSAPKKKTHFDNAADALAIALCHAHHIGLWSKEGVVI